MGMNIPLYPQFDVRKYGSVELSLDKPYVFKYHNDSGVHVLSIDNNSVLSEPDDNYSGEWKFEILVTRTFSIKNASILYGKDGIACTKAKIGICIIWTSSASFQRGVYDLGVLNNTDDEQIFELNATIPRSTLREKVMFTINFYIREAGEAEKEETFLANTKGMLIGKVEEFSVLLDGIQDFPIKNYSMERGPLWDVTCNWDDVNDSFLETVCIYFNTQNKLFRYVDKTKPEFDINLVREIIASAILQIIDRYKEYDENFAQLDSAVEGSVADYVRLYLKGWNVDYSSMNTMSRELRKKLEEKISKL